MSENIEWKKTEVGRVPVEWEIKTVKDLVKEKVLDKPLDGNHGGIHPKSKDFTENGIPFIMANDLINNRVNYENCKFISKKQALTLKKGFSKQGDILLTHKATIGRTAIVEEIPNSDYIILTPQVTYYRVKNYEILNNVYLKYYFDNKKFKKLFENWAGSGSTRAYLGITGQQKLPILLPSIEEQKKIASILKSLDDKIEINNKINETLEEMAQTIFKEWFVNFNFPNEEGKPYKDNGGKMVESELGMIPEGWRVEKLGNKINVTDYVANGSFKALKENVSLYDFPNEVLYVRTTDYNNNFKGNLKYTDKASYDFLKKSKLTGDEIIISNVGDVGTVFRAPVWLGLPMTLGSNAVSLYLENYNSYIYYYFKSRVGQHQVEAITTGSAQLKFNKTNLRSLEILIPNEVMLKKFGKIENKFYEKFKEIKKEIVILTKIRDNLLPKLMSGKVRV